MWDAFINFMLNSMILLYQLLGNNFILALAVFTVLVRLLMLPLNLRQQRASIKMQEMQPQVQAIQKKYRDNPQKMQEEFAKIGYNPVESMMGCLPLVIQMPIFFSLFRVINIMLDSTPQSLLALTERVNSNIDLTNLLPIDNTFLWLNLALPDPLIILPVLVGLTMFAQQRLLAPAKKPEDKNGKKGKNKAQDENPAAQMTQSMMYTMPVMFGFFAMSFSSGLSIYFIISNLIGIGQGWYVRRTMAGLREESAVRRERNEKAAEAYLSQQSEAAEDDAGDDDGDRIEQTVLNGANGKQGREPAKNAPTSKRKKRGKKRR